MRQTIAEKILSDHSGNTVKSEDVVVANVDFCFGQDITSSEIIDSFRKIGVKDIFNKERSCMVLDHSCPSPNIELSEVHKKIRNFTSEYDMKIFSSGEGVSHQVIIESGNITCGDIVVGADSHSCIFGALNVMAMGVGTTDLAIALATGKSWFIVPETVKVILDGQLSKGVFAKDVMLHVIGNVDKACTASRAIEFYGDVIGEMSVDARFTVSSVAAEMDAKCGIMPADKKTIQWAKKYSVREPRPVEADPDAHYSEIYEFDVSELSPQVSRPHDIREVCDIEDVEGTEIDQVCIGSCANGRLEDIEVASRILKGKKVAPGVKLIVTPASRKIYVDAMKKGYLEVLVGAGAIINNPGCGPCSGTHQGVLADGENAFSTSNKNSKGRMGNVNANIYLGSPAVAAATAIAGKIADPREYKRRLT